MSCNNINTQECCHENNGGFVFIIVLYILLAIILGSWLSC